MNTSQKIQSKDAQQQPVTTQGSMTVETDYELWNMLFPNNDSQGDHKLTKAEAFFDLIKRHRLATLTKDNNYLGGGILALAKAWGWDRNTVKKFVNSLCSVGAATIKKVGNKSIILITNVSYLHQNVSDT